MESTTAAELVEAIDSIPLDKLGAIAVLIVALAAIFAFLMWRQSNTIDRFIELIKDLWSRRNGK